MGLQDDIETARELLKELHATIERADGAVREAEARLQEHVREIHGLIQDLRQVATEQREQISEKVDDAIRTEIAMRLPAISDNVERVNKAIKRRLDRTEGQVADKLTLVLDALTKLGRSGVTFIDVTDLSDWERGRRPWPGSKRGK